MEAERAEREQARAEAVVVRPVGAAGEPRRRERQPRQAVVKEWSSAGKM
jgi:hypothetical protein